MEKRDRLITALKRRKPDKTPYYFELSESYEDIFEEKTGKPASEYQEYFNFEMVSIEPDNFIIPKSDYRSYFDETELPEIRINEWGVGYKKGSMYHFESLVYPLSWAKAVEDIRNYPYPDIAGYDDPNYLAYKSKIKKLQENGYAVMSRGQIVGGTIFWPAYKLRGMEQLLLDMYENPEMLTTLLDIVTETLIDVCEKKAAAGVDVLFLADDFGTQLNLIVGLEQWNHWFKERIGKVIAAAKKINPDVVIAFHSDGAVQELIPYLIEIGVEALNPVQPECMDPIEIKKKYGDKIALWGTIGTQTTMPFGSTAEVKETVKKMIEGCGSSGGLLIGPTHVIEPEVPWENVLAFIEAVEQYG